MVDFRKLAKSFHYAGEGFHYAFRSDQNFFVHICIAILVVGFAWFFKVTRFEIISLVLVIVLVILAELINTAIEKVVDLITLDHHPSAKIAKDVSAAMVLFAACSAVIIGIIIFAPYFFSLFH